MKFRKTKSGVAICPFFTWASENIGGYGHSENDVNLVHCSHPNNEDPYEGNCCEKICPLIRIGGTDGTTENANEKGK